MSQLDLRFALWNANGICQHRDEVESFIKNNNLDMLLVSETHLNDRSHFRIRGFDVIKCNRSDGAARGGSAIIVKSSIQYEECFSYCSEGVQVATIQIKCNRRNIKFSAIYCRPRDNLKEQDYKNIFDSIGGAFIAGGDYNAKHTWWGSRTCTVKGRELLRCVQNRNFTTFSTGTPTHWPARLHTMPDLLDFFVCSDINAGQFSVFPSFDLSSDHSPIMAIFHSSITLKHKSPRINLLKFRSKLEGRVDIDQPEVINNEQDLEEVTESLMRNIKESSEESIIPSSEYKVHVSLLIRNKIREKRRLKARYQNTLHRDDKNNLNRANKQLKRLLHEAEQSKIKDHVESLSANETGDKNLWSTTKFLKRPAIRYPPLEDPSGSGWIKSNVEKANKFAEHLEQQFTPFESAIDDNDVYTALDSPLQLGLPIREISLEEVKIEVKGLKTKKAPGFDGITNEMAKSLPLNALTVLTLIYNAILRIGTFPSLWKQSAIIVIHKPGKPEHLLTSYRPISLISVFSKIFEKLLKKRLEPHVKLPDHQFGFRSGHSTVEQCHRFVHHIQKALQEKKFCCGAFLDIQQAFDRVWHDGLLLKIKNQLPSPFFHIIKSYLSDRKFKVRYGGEESGWKTVRAGIPQGSVLGPLLYTIFTADMVVDEACITGTYADDTGYLSTHENLNEARRQLQSNLILFENWAKKWRLKISASKCEVITFCLRVEEPLPPLIINNQPLPEVATVRYLGMHLDKKLNFAHHIKTKINHLKLTLSKYNWLVGRQSSLSIENKIIIYKSIIRPMWAYAAVIWSAASDTNIKKIQVFQNKYLRSAVNAPWYVSNITNHRDMNIEMVRDYINLIRDKYTIRISNHENPLIIELSNDNILRRLSRRVIMDRL